MALVTLVIPCYDEATRLQADKFVGFVLADPTVHLLFVDDGSRDGTFEVLNRIRERAPQGIEVLRLEQNSGKPEAVRRGFMQAMDKPPENRPLFLGFWDADLATPLEELSAFRDVLGHQPAIDIVFGARVKLLGRNIERRALRHYFGRCFATAVSLALSLGVYDTQCGAKLFRVDDALRQVMKERFHTRWIFDVEILARYMEVYALRGVSIASRVVELPLRAWRDVAGSKVRLSAGLRAFVDLAWIWRHHVRPLRKLGRLPVPTRDANRIAGLDLAEQEVEQHENQDRGDAAASELPGANSGQNSAQRSFHETPPFRA